MNEYMHKFTLTLGLCCCLLAVSRAPAWAQDVEPIFSGKAYALNRVELRTFGTGKIKEINAVIGQLVKENSTLLSYEGDGERLSLLKKKLSLEKVYELEWKKQKLLRTLKDEMREANLQKNYLRENMTTEAQINNVNSSINSSEIELDAINEDITNAKDDVRSEQLEAWYTLGIRNAKSKDVKRLLRIHSPIMGHVLWMNSDFQPNAELKHDVRAFIIGDMTKVKLVCEAYEASVKNVKENQKVNVKFDAIDNKVYPGVVSKTQWASANAEDKSKPSLFEVEVFIDNSKLEIKEGYVGHVYTIN